MEFYIFFFALISTATLLLHFQVRKTAKVCPTSSPSSPSEQDEKVWFLASVEEVVDLTSEAAAFKRTYFSAYTLVLAADWLQGPFIYQIYHEDHKLPESTIAALFATGFLAAGVSATFMGGLADRFGRRKACLCHCICVVLSCSSVLSSSLPALFAGRAIGGLGSTLLYSVFEAYMVSEHKRGYFEQQLPLSEMLSQSTALSGLVAILAGIAGEVLVEATDSRASPFILAAFCLLVAAIVISQSWGENYGESSTNKFEHDENNQQTTRGSSTRTFIALALVSTAFEGAMFVFVFFWTPALSESRRISANSTNFQPLGLIFSCFMCAMVLGSLTFTLVLRYSTQDGSALNLALLHILAVASAAMFIPALFSSETVIFLSFLVFEACVGVYYPVMGRIKSKVVAEAGRAKVYAWMRLPLNLFVLIAMGNTHAGTEYRNIIFGLLGCMLLLVGSTARKCLA